MSLCTKIYWVFGKGWRKSLGYIYIVEYTVHTTSYVVLAMDSVSSDGAVGPNDLTPSTFPLLQRQSNASQTLCDIIRLSRDQANQMQENVEPDPLLAVLES